MADLDTRMKMLVLNIPDEAHSGGTFKERAEYFYEKRPQLLALLQDLYLGYLALSDKYIQILAKQNRHSQQSSLLSSADNDFHDYCRTTPFDSDAESTLSYQPHPVMYPSKTNVLDVDHILAELVIKNVEVEVLADEVIVSEKRYHDSARKIELQKSLLEVLESERLILLNENANLCSQVETLMEENKELESESAFVKRQASDMARILVKTMEEQRVGMVNHRVDDLWGRVQGSDKKNDEYYEQLVNNERIEKVIEVDFEEATGKKSRKKKLKNGSYANFKFLHPAWKLKRESSKKIKNESSDKKKNPKWWAKVKIMDFLRCGSEDSSSK